MTTAGDMLQLVRQGRASSRSDLVRLTGLSRTAVTARLSALEDLGLVLAGDELASTGGRPAGGIGLDARAGVVLTAAIGRSRSQLALFDLAGHELRSSSVEHEVGAPPDVVMPDVATQLTGLLADLPGGHRGRPPVLGTGISLPGTVDPVLGVSIDSPAMTGWDRVDLGAFLADVEPGPTFVANDADVLARSEGLGHAATYRDLLVVKASTGLGLGIVSEGRVVPGHLGAAGEIGHTKVHAAEGRPCRCGDVGCLETIAGGWALVAELQAQGHRIGHVRDVVARAVGGDAEAKHHLREAGRSLGEVLAVAINLLNPHAVVIGGDMSAAFEVYSAGVRESVYARASALATRDLQFLSSTFGDRAGLVGCAAMVLDQVLSPAAVDTRILEREASASR
ncbi:ROK family transcriptional regulator [Nocardioides dongxiaopingii]|uniref:ROK family transcriptional regulator n=1 Tax=Nocardioides dongxiaopingii TaxID=2576036 RepID=UPI001FE91C4C|nr:ROK family transcriptional regulator [Nocardioides dongxiaopingii]